MPHRLTQTVFLFVVLLIANVSFGKQNTDLFHLRNLLQAHDYKAVEKLLSDYNDNYLKGVKTYREYYWSIKTLWKNKDLKDTWMEESLHNWLKTSPDSAYVLIVLGAYYIDKGFDARGEKWASETSVQQFSEMRKYFAKAYPYLEKGLEKNPNIILGYTSILKTLKTSGNTMLTPVEYMKQVPASIKSQEAIWRVLLDSIVPRWGGSYEKISQIIDNDIPKFMPNLSDIERQTLKDTISYDKMLSLMLEDKYQQVIEMAENSIQANTEYAGVYELASSAERQLKNYNKCYQYGKIAAHMRPFRIGGVHGFCAFKVQKWNDMNKAYRHKLILHDIQVYSVFQLGVSYMYLKQYDKAYALFIKSETLDPEYKQYTKMYTKWIESDQKDKTNLVGKDIYAIIGKVTFEQ